LSLAVAASVLGMVHLVMHLARFDRTEELR